MSKKSRYCLSAHRKFYNTQDNSAVSISNFFCIFFLFLLSGELKNGFHDVGQCNNVILVICTSCNVRFCMVRRHVILILRFLIWKSSGSSERVLLEWWRSLTRRLVRRTCRNRSSMASTSSYTVREYSLLYTSFTSSVHNFTYLSEMSINEQKDEEMGLIIIILK